MDKPMILKDNTVYTNQVIAVNGSYLLSEIVNKSLSDLKKDNVFVMSNVPGGGLNIKDKDDKKIIIKEGNGLKTGNIMGFLGYKDELLTIRSRFSPDEEEENDYFIQYMLTSIFKYEPPAFIKYNTVSSQINPIFDFLIFLFPYYLKTALKKGILKTYVKKEYNDLNVRGTIDIARHIRKNVPFTGKIAYRNREQALDNYVTELIRHTIEYIKGKSQYGRILLNDIKDEVRVICEITSSYNINDRQQIIRQNKKYGVTHSYFHEYRDLQKICISILEHKKLQLAKGSDKIYGVLFDGSWLWEEYINSLIKEWYYHPDNRKKKGTQTLFTAKSAAKYFDFKNKNIMNPEMYPDFVSKEYNSERVVLDAKYKPRENIGRYNDNSDFYQICTYMLRFRSEKGAFVYPESNNFKAYKLCIDEGYDYGKGKDENSYRDDSVIVYPFIVPRAVDASSYNYFKRGMNNSEKKFRNEAELLFREIEIN